MYSWISNVFNTSNVSNTFVRVVIYNSVLVAWFVLGKLPQFINICLYLKIISLNIFQHLKICILESPTNYFQVQSNDVKCFQTVEKISLFFSTNLNENMEELFIMALTPYQISEWKYGILFCKNQNRVNPLTVLKNKLENRYQTIYLQA